MTHCESKNQKVKHLLRVAKNSTLRWAVGNLANFFEGEICGNKRPAKQVTVVGFSLALTDLTREESVVS
jgi:hypothetical protein